MSRSTSPTHKNRKRKMQHIDNGEDEQGPSQKRHKSHKERSHSSKRSRSASNSNSHNTNHHSNHHSNNNKHKHKHNNKQKDRKTNNNKYKHRKRSTSPNNVDIRDMLSPKTNSINGAIKQNENNNNNKNITNDNKSTKKNIFQVNVAVRLLPGLSLNTQQNVQAKSDNNSFKYTFNRSKINGLVQIYNILNNTSYTVDDLEINEETLKEIDTKCKTHIQSTKRDLNIIEAIVWLIQREYSNLLILEQIQLKGREHANYLSTIRFLSKKLTNKKISEEVHKNMIKIIKW
eukprot:101284_1